MSLIENMAKKRFLNELLSAREINNNFAILKNIATNIFEYENFKNSYILENYLFFNGRACIFFDKHINAVFPLNIETILKWDIYNRPTEFIAVAEDNSFRVKCKSGDNAVIVYDKQGLPFNNNTAYLTDRYAQKLALCDRLIELNIFQQKSSKIYQVPSEKKNSFEQIFEKIDTFEPHVMAYKGMNIEELTVIDTNTEFLADKIYEVRQRLFDEYIQLVGGVSYSESKKERIITDEIYFKQGGTIITRKAKLKARQSAFEEVKRLFGFDIKFNFAQEITTDIEGGG